MFGFLDKRPWIVVEHSQGLSGHSERVRPALRTRAEAIDQAKRFNAFSPYGRVYHVHYSWEARPATQAEIDLYRGISP